MPPPRQSAGSASSANPARAAPPPPIAVDRTVASSSAAVAMSPSRQAPPQHESSSWMRMLSSTFLGDASLFTRRAPALMNSSPSSFSNKQNKNQSKHGLDHTPTFKIALVGGSGVGKTSILRRWLQRPYASKYSPTIGVDVISTSFRYKNEELLLQIWDVASVEVDTTQTALHSLICENLDGIFFVFNVHRVSSIAAVDKWRHALAKYISAKEIPFFLLAHKADLIQKRIMSSDDIASYARAGGYRGWMWTVGRSNFGENEKHPAVLEVLEKMVDCMWKERQLKPRNATHPVGIFDDSPESSSRRALDVVYVDADLHSFSASLLRIPTKAITTLPRDDNLLPIEETFGDRNKKKATTTQDLSQRKSSFGGNWMLGNEKGLYLRVTDDSVVADHEESEEEEDEEEKEDEEGEEEGEDKGGASDGGENEEENGEEEKNEEEESQGETLASGKSIASESHATAVENDATTRANTSTAEALPTAVDVVVVAVDEQPKKTNVSDTSDHDAWRFFAGSISRARAEEILSGREEGTFLLRRKDAQTLILSYVGPEQLHHALIEFKQGKYHVGSAKTSQAAFATLSRCLRSVRKYANRGLVFTRNTDFRVVNKEEMALQEDQHHNHKGVHTRKGAANHSNSLHVATTSSSWRPGSTTVTPKTAKKLVISPKKRVHRPSSGLLAQQEHVRVPPSVRIGELASTFYEQLIEQLQAVATTQQTQAETPEQQDGNRSVGFNSSIDIDPLLEMVHHERKELQSMAAGDAEDQWRHLVTNMELWNRIVMNLDIN